MIAVLKWTTVAYLAVLGATAVSFAMCVHGVLKPVAIVVLGALTPVLFPPILFVFAAAPRTASDFQLIVAAAIAIYLWLLALMLLGWMVKTRSRLRRPSMAMY